jgi:hypothetical protein
MFRKTKMTTSITTSTIPEYNPNEFFYEPKPVPRVSYEGRENYHRNRGTLNLGDWAEQGKDWESPRPVPKVKYGDAQTNLEKSQGTFFKYLLSDF